VRPLRSSRTGLAIVWRPKQIFPTHMAGIITRLVYQKRNRQRVNVYLDDAYAFALPDLEAARLHIGQQLDEDEMAQLQRVGEDAKARDRALRLLGTRPRSEHEIRTRLRKAAFDDPTCQRVLQRLQEQGYVDDAEFVQWWLQNRNQFHPSGRRLLAAELRQKGIAPDLITHALTHLDEQTLAVAATQQRVSRWAHLDRENFRRKMLAFLQRRGFSYSSSGEACEQAWSGIHESSSPSYD